MRLLHFYILFLSSFYCEAQSDSTKYQVIFFLAEDCKICQYYPPLFNELNATFASDSISFLGLFPNRYSSEENIKEYREKYQVDIPLKREYYATQTKSYGVTITPEVVIRDTENDTTLYQGRIDNAFYKLGRRRRIVSAHELKDALEDIVNGRKIRVDRTKPIGCYITFRD